MFETLLGAIFLDFNKINVNDENNWFSDVFITGPGFQITNICNKCIWKTCWLDNLIEMIIIKIFYKYFKKNLR